MKRLIIFIFICAVGLCSYAQQQVNLEVAMKVGANIIGQKTKSAAAVDTLFYYLGQNNDTLMYQINYDDGTYVLMSGSYACFPVLSVGRIQNNSAIWSGESNDNDALICLINSYKEQIESCFSNDTITMYHKEDWMDYFMGESLNKKSRSYVEPLVTTRWGQSTSNDNHDLNAYNYYCPNSTGGSNNCLTGCGATAMAQIMNYWKYPRYDYRSDYQFDWCNMVDELYTNSPNYINERAAIAKLMRTCGEIIRTQYCSNENNESTSYTDTTLLGLLYYGYKGRIIDCNNLQSISEIVKQDISSGRPVLYRGSDANGDGGHIFICDGYDSSGLFHINWGWNDCDDNYFFLDGLCPGDHSYTKNNRAIVGIEPNTDDAEEMREWCALNIELVNHYVAYYDLLNMTQYEPWENVINTTDDLVSIPIDERYPSSWRTIPSGESSEYVAHKSITLQPGFHAERGSTFTARIVPCSNCDSEEMSSLTQQTMMPGGGNSEDSSMLSKSVVTDSNNEEVSDNRLFPNPSHETITYQGKEVASMGIYDMTGKAVYRWFIVSKTENEIVVNIKDLRPSMYVLLLNMSDGTREVVRFIKE